MKTEEIKGLFLGLVVVVARRAGWLEKRTNRRATRAFKRSSEESFSASERALLLRAPSSRPTKEKTSAADLPAGSTRPTATAGWLFFPYALSFSLEGSAIERATYSFVRAPLNRIARRPRCGLFLDSNRPRGGNVGHPGKCEVRLR